MRSIINLVFLLGLVVLTASQAVDYSTLLLFTHEVNQIKLSMLFHQFNVSKSYVRTAKYTWQQVPDGVGYPPLDREGTVYGNVGGQFIYFAGGVNSLYPSTSTFTAFTDIYTYDTSKYMLWFHFTAPGRPNSFEFLLSIS